MKKFCFIVVFSSLLLGISYTMEDEDVKKNVLQKMSAFHKYKNILENSSYLNTVVDENLPYDRLEDQKATNIEKEKISEFVEKYISFFDKNLEIVGNLKKFAEIVVQNSEHFKAENYLFTDSFSIAFHGNSYHNYFKNLFEQSIETLRSQLFFQEAKVLSSQEANGSLGLVVVETDNGLSMGVGCLIQKDILITANHNFPEGNNPRFLPFLTKQEIKNNFYGEEAESYVISKIEHLGDQDVSLAKIESEISSSKTFNLSFETVKKDEKLYIQTLSNTNEEDYSYSIYKMCSTFLGDYENFNVFSQRKESNGMKVIDGTLLPGMSGSPVFNNQNELVGIFTRATTVRNIDKDYTYTDRYLFVELSPIKDQIMKIIQKMENEK